MLPAENQEHPSILWWTWDNQDPSFSCLRYISNTCMKVSRESYTDTHTHTERWTLTYCAHTYLLWRSRSWLRPPTRRLSLYSVLACRFQTLRCPGGSQAVALCPWTPRTASLEKAQEQRRNQEITLYSALGTFSLDQMRVLSDLTQSKEENVNHRL